MKKRAVQPSVNVGYISLLMIFMILCLAVFVALALTRANADHHLTERTGETAVSFYEAQNLFQNFLCDLDGVLLREGGNDAAIQALLQEGMAYDDARGVISAQWPAGERLLLRVEILVKGVEASAGEADTGTAGEDVVSISEDDAGDAQGGTENVESGVGEDIESTYGNDAPRTERYKVLSAVMSPVQENVRKTLDNLWNGDDFVYENS